MLINENNFYQSRVLIVMSDIAILAAFAKSTLLEVSKQQFALGEGLQNAAPGEKSGTPNKSVQYLLTGSEYLAKLAVQCDELIETSSHATKHESKI